MTTCSHPTKNTFPDTLITLVPPLGNVKKTKHVYSAMTAICDRIMRDMTYTFIIHKQEDVATVVILVHGVVMVSVIVMVICMLLIHWQLSILSFVHAGCGCYHH